MLGSVLHPRQCVKRLPAGKRELRTLKKAADGKYHRHQGKLMEEMDSVLDLKEYMGIEYEDGQRKQQKIGDGPRSIVYGA